MDITVLFILVVLVLALLGAIDSKLRRTDRRVARLERHLQLVMEHLGVRDGDPELGQVAALLREGHKIKAIKLYREITGADLVEAKTAVERMEGGV
ncbi:ribosomal protein L7/L12 [Streptomyces sp. ISL-99]|uniref:ribosomal protein L7/L12 n=1 Tax=Streptomyces sp. ISL-99 TaxID=2819193 RepID=UPI001BEAD39B|nr:ribosomal protein L7/L12 [Streptomyces sp. ISL-99]MBT2529912.1 ribosomal protein L7/L12 [Streptomyces sp. ISL-99]